MKTYADGYRDALRAASDAILKKNERANKVFGYKVVEGLIMAEDAVNELIHGFSKTNPGPSIGGDHEQDDG